MEEVWKDIPEYEGLYQVSNLGRVRSLDRTVIDRIRSRFFKSRILKPDIDKDGYLRVVLSNVTRKTIHIHRLVAQVFIPNPENKETVNHKNSIRIDNQVENLEWCTSLENNRHAWKMGFKNSLHCRGENHYGHKLSQEDVEFIRKNYKPYDKKFGANPLGRKFGVTHSVIWKIATNKSWKHI